MGRRRRLPIFLKGNEPELILGQLERGRDKLIFLIGIYAGLRVSEIVGRRVEDVDQANSLLEVRQGKGDKDRTVPISPKLLEPLKAWIGARTLGWLFPSPRNPDGHLSARQVQLSIQAAAKRAGIAKKITPHKLRHTFAGNLLRAGADIMEIRELLGHESVATTQVYLQAIPERLRGAVDRL